MKMSDENSKTNHRSKLKLLLDKKKCLLRRLGKVLNSLGDRDREEFSKNENPRSSLHDELNIDPEFAEMREERFLKLKKAVAKNVSETCGYGNTYDTEKISLQIEQRAILAAILGPVYIKVVNDLISGVKAATKAKRAYFPIDATSKFSSLESFPSSSSMASNNGARSNFTVRECVPTPPPVAKVIPTVAVVTPKPTEVIVKVEKPFSRVLPQLNEAPEAKAENEEEVEAGLTDFLCHMDESPNQEDQLEVSDEVMTDLNCQVDLSPNHDGDLDDSMPVNDELETLMRILEGDEDEDENHEGGQTKSHCSLNDRIQVMFGEEEEEEESRPAVTDAKNSHEAALKKKAIRKRIDQWRNQRYIFLHKVFKSTKKMNAFRFYRVRRHFTSHFGEDSDFEHEEEFDDHEKFTECCVRQVSPTVVNFIRPYYRQKRINCSDSYIFKNLVTRIADSLVNTNYDPSDHDVRCQVDAFFPPGKKYMTLTDIWCFEP